MAGRTARQRLVPPAEVADGGRSERGPAWGQPDPAVVARKSFFRRDPFKPSQRCGLEIAGVNVACLMAARRWAGADGAGLRLPRSTTVNDMRDQCHARPKDPSGCAHFFAVRRPPSKKDLIDRRWLAAQAGMIDGPDYVYVCDARRLPLAADSFQNCRAVLSLIHPLPSGLMADTPVGPMVLATSGQDWQRTLRPTHQMATSPFQIVTKWGQSLTVDLKLI